MARSLSLRLPARRLRRWPPSAVALALAVSAWDRSRPLARWRGASVVWLLGAFGWSVGAIMSPGQRLLYAFLAIGLLLPSAIWLRTMSRMRRHTQG